MLKSVKFADIEQIEELDRTGQLVKRPEIYEVLKKVFI